MRTPDESVADVRKHACFLRDNAAAGTRVWNRAEATLQVLDELEWLRDRLARLRALFPGDVEMEQEDDATCAKCNALVSVDDEAEWEAGHSVCHPCAQGAYAEATAALRT